MTEIEKLHGLHNTGMTMHERFTLLTRQAVGRRKMNPAQARTRGRGRTNPALLEAIVNQLNQGQTPVYTFRGRGRGRGRGNLRRAGSEGSIRSMPGLRRGRSNSFVEDQSWRRSNGNISSYAGSVNGSIHSTSNATSKGYWLRGNAQQNQGFRGRGRGRGFGRGQGIRGRANRGRVNRLSQPPRPARGSGRRGLRRSLPPGHAPRRAWGRARGRAARGTGIARNQTPKPVPTKEELDAQLDQYMAGTKAALDKQLDEYMRNAMDFD